MPQVALLLPRGRIVRGNLYKPNEKDAEGNPLVTKSGPNKGQPRVDYFFAVAIPKGVEQHWSQTPWGATIAKSGQEAFPVAWQAPTFSWKVTDGDSQIPNKKGRKPVDNVGYPGHWVVGLSSGFAPKVYTDGGDRALTEVGAVKPGYWVEVAATVDGNGSASQPGVFMNHQMVCFINADTEIVMGPDATAVGFTKGGGMPPGVVPNAFQQAPVQGAVAGFPGVPMQAPVAGGFPGAPAAGFPGVPMQAPVAGGFPGVPMQAPVAGGFPVAPAAGFPGAAPAQVAVAPNPGFLMAPPAQMAPPPVRQLTAKAQGNTYEQLIANGWTDAVLIANGVMLP